MNKKLFIILVCIFGTLLTAYFILLGVFHDTMIKYTLLVWEKLNEPLPVVGMSTLMVLILVWKLFSSSSFGKKQINEFKRNAQETKDRFEELKANYEEKINEYEEVINKYEQLIKEYEEYFTKICEVIPNKKVKQIGVEFNERKETVND